VRFRAATEDNIYRELAGGYDFTVTSWFYKPNRQPISIVKWKWGAGPEEMLYKVQPKFIKFALGKNVKQASGR
jgi:hypothetical protein